MNEKEFDFLGITKWHEAGYKGQGIKIASKECIQVNTFDDVHTYRYETDDSRFSIHGTRVMDYIRQVAPDSYKIAFDMRGSSHNGILTSEGADFVLKEQPDIITTSQWGNSDLLDSRMNIYKHLAKNGTYFVCAAGNSDFDGAVKIAKGNFWKAVGSCRLNNGQPVRATYSAIDKELDFMCLDNLYTTIDNKRHYGTSFAAPVFAGMLALVQCFFLKNIYRKLSKEELEKFVQLNCRDLGDVGVDDKHGYGLFILPDPFKLEAEIMEIVLKIGDKKAVVNGQTVELDVPPKIENGRTLVPLRFIAEHLGHKVIWDELERKIIIN